MFMTAAERESPPAPNRVIDHRAPLADGDHKPRALDSGASPRVAVGRSPFVRLRELLGDAPPPPGKPAISLAVGEPQHGVPPFVGPVLNAHVEEWGRYPMNK